MQSEKATFVDFCETNGMQSSLNCPYFATIFTSDAFLCALVVVVTSFLFPELIRLDACVSLEVTLVLSLPSVSARENKFV